MIPEKPDNHTQTEGREESAAATTADSGQQPPATTLRHARFSHLAWAAGGLILGVIATTLLVRLGTRHPAPPPLIRFSIDLPRDAPLAPGAHSLAFSPDGTQLAYVAQVKAETQLYLRALDQLEAKPVPGTRGACDPFFSPDGAWLGYFDSNASQLKKVPLSGGEPVPLGQVQSALGACWGPDGSIMFAPDMFSGLLRIPPAGGNPEPLTKLGNKESTHRWPTMLPDGKTVIFTIGTAGTDSNTRLAAVTLKTGQKKILLDDAADAVFSPPGRLLFMRRGDLMAVAFDPARLEPAGTPFVVKAGIETDRATGSGHFAYSRAGALAYVTRIEEAGFRVLAWADREGGIEKLTVNRGAFSYPRLSPDGRRLAVVIRAMDDKSNVWILDVDSGKFNRLTFEGNNSLPAWSPDGKRLAFASDRDGQWNLFSVSADGSGAAEPLQKSENPQMPGSWSADGRFLAFTEFAPKTGPDIWVLTLDGERVARPFLQTRYAEWGGEFSPDGRWLAYTSDETGPDQVYVQAFPGPGERFQISTAEGREPVWRHDGLELFFRYWKGLMSVTMLSEGEFRPDPPRLAVSGDYEAGEMPMFPNYDVSPDGKRFVMIPQESIEKRQIQIDWNCFDELTRPRTKTRR